MGKSLIQQRRGKGSARFRAPSFKYKGKVKYPKVESNTQTIKGEIVDIITCRGHSAPLMVVEYDNRQIGLSFAPEGVRVGDEVSNGANVERKTGNTMHLKDIPEGTQIYNIEVKPGDGGKFVRAGGAKATVFARSEKKVVVTLPSKKHKDFHPMCKATIGTIAGGGRLDKPMMKAGNKHYAMKAKNKFWPKVCATSMNAVVHPFGGSRSSKKNMPYTTSRDAPPGRKVGRIAARRTGRKKK